MKNYLYLLLCLLLGSSFTGFAQNKKDAKGLKQGAWVKIDPAKKNKLYEGSFVDDKPNGLFKYYFPSGKIKAITTYSENGTKARAILFDEAGNKISEGCYLNEKKDSIWNYYNPDHTLIAQESYVNTKKHGVWRVYYENGKLYEEQIWQNGVKEGSWKQFFKNGNPKTEANYKAGELDGSMKLFFPDGKLELNGTYVNAMREGNWLNYLPGGDIKTIEHYQSGTLLSTEYINGVFTETYPNDVLKSSITYKEGKKNGAFTEYYNAGQWKRRLKPAVDDFPAEEEEYFEGQQIKQQGNYLNNQLHGKLIHYKTDGKIEKTEEYEKGKLVSSK